MSFPRSSKRERAGGPLPSRREAWQRLHAADPPAWVVRHSLCVEALAVAMAQRAGDAGLDVDHGLVARGALLHDIGRSVTQGLDHAYRGADMLREPPAWPRPVVRVVETHTGAGVDPDSARRGGLPERDYIPRLLEERIVAHADNLHSGDKRVTLDQVVGKYEARGLAEAGTRIHSLHTELERLLDCDLDTLEPASLPAP